MNVENTIQHRVGDNWQSDVLWSFVNSRRIILHLWRDGLKDMHGYVLVDGVMAQIGDVIVFTYPDKLEVRKV